MHKSKNGNVMNENVKKKGGRPAKLLVKNVVIRIRLDKQEQLTLCDRAKAAGQSLSQYIRQTALGGKVMARLTADEKEMIRKLIGMCTNLNQLTREARRTGMMATALAFETYRQNFDEILKTARRDK